MSMHEDMSEQEPADSGNHSWEAGRLGGEEESEEEGDSFATRAPVVGPSRPVSL